MSNEVMDYKPRKQCLLWLSSLLWAVGVAIFSLLPGATAQALYSQGIDWMDKFVRLLFSDEVSSSVAPLLAPLVLMVFGLCGFGGFSLLLWLALSARGLRNRHALVLTLASTALLAVITEMLQLLVVTRITQVADWAIKMACGIFALACIWLCQWLWNSHPRIFNKEIITYVVFGVITTLVNMVSFGFFFNILGVHNLISNAIAWVIAVLFAYFVNKLFVFHSHTETLAQVAREFWLFIAARAFSFVVDELGMWLLVNVLAVNSGISKIAVNIIVMIMNYFFSKVFIFKQTQPSR